MNSAPINYHALVDIGGTKLSISLVRADAAPFSQRTPLLAQRTELTAQATPQPSTHNAIPQQIIRMVSAACTSLGVTLQHISSVNVATCGLFLKGEWVAPNLQRNSDWTSIPLAQRLREGFDHADCPVRIENDGVAALMAERRWGALQGTDNAAYVTWSTGIGVGLLVDGHVLRGKNGNAGHAGHMVVADAVQGDSSKALRCACGNMNDAQSQIAGSYMAKRWPRYASAQSLLEAARGEGDLKDAIAASHVESLCEGMSRVLYNLTTTLDLERIAMGGSVFWHHKDQLLPRLQQLVSHRFTAMTHGLSIVPAGLGASVGDYAALAVLAHAERST